MRTVQYLAGSLSRYFPGKFGSDLKRLERYLNEAAAQLELNGEGATMKTHHGMYLAPQDFRRFAELVHTIIVAEAEAAQLTGDKT